MITGRQADGGTGGDVVFLPSSRVMSSHHHLPIQTLPTQKVVAVLSIHCRHGYCSGPTQLSSVRSRRPVIGRRVAVAEPRSNGRGGERCHEGGWGWDGDVEASEIVCRCIKLMWEGVSRGSLHYVVINTCLTALDYASYDFLQPSLPDPKQQNWRGSGGAALFTTDDPWKAIQSPHSSLSCNRKLGSELFPSCWLHQAHGDILNIYQRYPSSPDSLFRPYPCHTTVPT